MFPVTITDIVSAACEIARTVIGAGFNAILISTTVDASGGLYRRVGARLGAEFRLPVEVSRGDGCGACHCAASLANFRTAISSQT